jgi:hypothetical protein
VQQGAEQEADGLNTSTPTASPECEGLDTEFSARLFFSAPAVYDEIRINQTELIFTYYRDVDDTCPDHWQAACWTLDDLVTENVTLSNCEVINLVNIVNTAGYMGLNNTYGDPGEWAKYYPYYLLVRIGDEEKEVVYKYYPLPSPPPVPEAFRIVWNELRQLVEKKLGIHCSGGLPKRSVIDLE